MMNTKREGCTSSEPVKEEVVVASTVPVPVPGPPSQPKMVDMPSPLPGMSEEQFSMFDSGTNLGSMDVTNDSENGMY
jgi:hypothetical protein